MASPRPTPAAAPADIAPAALAALGPVLCLHDAREPHPLSGWRRAVSAHVCIRLDSDGPSEAICFEDGEGRHCWQLHRLPASDFLAWEQVASRLPQASAPGPAPRGVIGRRQATPAWRPCALRLHAVPGLAAPLALAAAEVELSAPGRAVAERIARRLGGLRGATTTG